MTTEDNPQKEYIITQWMRSFTVSIHKLTGDELSPKNIIGTGIAVSIEGQIITCAHVLRNVGIDPRNANDAEIGVYYPQASTGARKSYRATVAACFAHHDDDIVLLQLVDGPSPLAPEEIAVLGYAEDSFYHPFRSFGFRRLGSHYAAPAHGLIQTK